MVVQQRKARSALLRSQQHRARQNAFTRSAEFRRGLKGVWDWMTGRRLELQRKHAAQLKVERRVDARERHRLVERQLMERKELQQLFLDLRRKHATERSLLARQIGQSLRQVRFGSGAAERDRSLEPGSDLRRGEFCRKKRDFSLNR